MRDVAIIGAGPAGAVLGARLARAGLDVVIIERSPAWRWRAGGVFASPAAVEALRRAGLTEEVVRQVTQPIPALRLETVRGAVVRLTYGADAHPGAPTAVGFDRGTLDPALVDQARLAGASVWTGVAVREVDLGVDGRGATVHVARDRAPLTARVVVGADGARSLVARAAGVARPVRLAPRVGLSFHLVDPRGEGFRDARMCVLRDGYIGLAPVPGGRINVGIVLGRSWAGDLATHGATAVASGILAGLRSTPEDRVRWEDATRTDTLSGAAPLGVRVTQRAGPGWILVGDAAGFLDPFTGEGLHRALGSTELAAPAIVAAVRGIATPARAAAAYDRAMRRRFATKDAVSWLVQSFLGHPSVFEYAARRLATRPDARATMGLVMGDLVPASRGLDPRFLAALLAP